MADLKVVKNSLNSEGYSSWGGNHWLDLVGTKEGTAPIVGGVWKVDDFTDGQEVVKAEWDEIKYIHSSALSQGAYTARLGRCIWKDATNNSEHVVEAGDMVWLPKGCKTILRESVDLQATYVEQNLRPVAEETIVGAEDGRQSLSELLEKLHEQFRLANPQSSQAFEQATQSLPGGNTRSVLYYAPFPLVISSGRDCHVTSLDGREYLDLVSEYTAALFGHSNVIIQQAVLEAMGKGFTLGGPNQYEARLAAALKQRFASIEQLRFCNSGTEANMMVIALAKAYKKRQQILVFDNGYHGGTLTFDRPNSPVNLPHDFVVAKYNDIPSTERLLSTNIAAILVEPLQSAGGMIPGDAAFLHFLRSSADRIGALLIFDEVVTARLHISGLQGLHRITPDLTTLGKSIGGGFSVGAFGGARRVMSLLDPRANGALSHSGTFNNNLFTMCTGLAAHRLVTAAEGAAIVQTNALGDLLRDGLTQIFAEFGLADVLYVTGYGSLVGLHVRKVDPASLKKALYLYMLSKGVYMGSRGFMALNFEHRRHHVEAVLASMRGFCMVLKRLELRPAIGQAVSQV